MPQVSDADIKQMQTDQVGKIPVIKLIRECEGVGLADAKRRADKFDDTSRSDKGWFSVAWNVRNSHDEAIQRGDFSPTFQRLKAAQHQPVAYSETLLMMIEDRLRKHCEKPESVRKSLEESGITVNSEEDFLQEKHRFADWLMAKYTFDMENWNV